VKGVPGVGDGTLPCAFHSPLSNGFILVFHPRQRIAKDVRNVAQTLRMLRVIRVSTPASSTPDAMISLIRTAAQSAGANPEIAVWIAQHQSQLDPTTVGDKNFVCNLPNSPLYGQITPSYGLYQINQCSHPDISIASSEDPTFAANWAAQQIATGNTDVFSSWKMRCLWYEAAPNC